MAVAFVAVHPRRSDVASMLGVSARITIGSSCVGLAMPWLSARTGADAVIQVNAMTSLLGAALHAIAFSLILVSIVRLAKPRAAPREL